MEILTLLCFIFMFIGWCGIVYQMYRPNNYNIGLLSGISFGISLGFCISNFLVSII